jgi:cytochrome P450
LGAGREPRIGNGLLALYRNPDQLRLLKNDPSLVANAIDEFLRYGSSVQVTSRTTLEDVDEIGGISLEKGRTVVCLLGSANRDPTVYPDPDLLDITGRDVRPLSFGGGLHYCWCPARPHRRRDCDCDAVATLPQSAAQQG